MASPNSPPIPLPVSIVIPVRDGAAFLRRAVASALRQDAREIIIVDNLSTDETPDLIRELATRHPVIIGTACSTPGASAARNHGLRLATGEWVQFLDADDALGDDKLAAQLALADPATDWIIAGYRNRYPDGTATDNFPHPDPWKGLVFRYRIGCTHANLYRKRALTDIRGWDEQRTREEDTDLHFRLLANGAPYRLQHAITCVYHHRPFGQLTTSAPEEGQRARLELVLGVCNYLRRQHEEYWRDNQPYFDGAVVRALRAYATYNPGAAAGAWVAFRERGGGTRPPRLVSALLWNSYRLLGFRRTESLRLRLAGLLPTALKTRLK